MFGLATDTYLLLDALVGALFALLTYSSLAAVLQTLYVCDAAGSAIRSMLGSYLIKRRASPCSHRRCLR